MLITLSREIFTDNSTIGRLSINGQPLCYTLEDVPRATKVYGKTSIPYGMYEIIINYSNRFKQQMPLLLNVPQFNGIRTHWGNTAEDTSGCILVGKTIAKDFIGESKIAYSEIFPIIDAALKIEKVWIEIKS